MKYIITSLLIFYTSSVCWPQRYAPVKTVKDSTNFITREKLLSDIDEYADGIARNHIDPFSYIKRRTFFDEIRKIKDSADKYDIDELLVQLLKVNAMIQDEHTNILYGSRDFFPLYCHWFEEGIFIIKTEADNQNLLYSTLIAVNDIPINEVISRISTLSADKNTAGYKKAVQKYLFDPFIIHGLQISPSRQNIIYTVVTMKNDTIKVKLGPKDRKYLKFDETDQNLLRESRRGSYWYTYNNSGNYIYFKYASCYNMDKDHLFADMEKDLVNDIDSKKPGKIIIDMRDNGGGYPRQLEPFIDYLSRSALNKKGKIYVLVGRNTFSAAILNSVAIKRHTYAILVGEETSGSVAFYAGVKYFTLPETKLMVQYSTQYVATDEKYEGALRPDIVIPDKFADYYRGVDSALEYAISQ